MSMVNWGIITENFLSYITVTPEMLTAQAVEAKKSIGQIKKSFKELETIINKTKHYWIGEAGDAHRTCYEKKQDDIAEMFKRLDEDVSDLYQIASVYSETEVQIANDLPSDVIV